MDRLTDSSDSNTLDNALGLRHRVTMLFETFDMKLNRFPNQSEGFLSCLAHRNASGKIRNVRPKSSFTRFDDDDVLHGFTSFSSRPVSEYCSGCLAERPGSPSQLR
jgi:hypothetical protein